MSLERYLGPNAYSSHNTIPDSSRGFGASTIGGKPFQKVVLSASDLSDDQKIFENR